MQNHKAGNVFRIFFKCTVFEEKIMLTYKSSKKASSSLISVSVTKESIYLITHLIKTKNTTYVEHYLAIC